MSNIDDRLHEAGDRWRAEHAQPARVDVERLVQAAEPTSLTIAIADEAIPPRRRWVRIAPFAAAALVAVVVGAVMVIARSSDHTTHRPAQPTIMTDPKAVVGIEWQLVQVLKDGVDSAIPTQVDVPLRFDGKGKVTGKDGCNYIGGDVSVNAGTMTVSRMGTTLIGCPAPEVMRLTRAVDTVLAGGSVTWRITDGHLHLTKGDTELVYQVRPSIYPSDGQSTTPHVLQQAKQGTGDYRLYYTTSSGYIAVSFESRDAPGSRWGFGGQNRPVGWTPNLSDSMDCQADMVDGSRFVWGLAPAAAARITFRDKTTGQETELTRYPLPGAEHFQAYGGFVGNPPRGSTVVEYGADGALLGTPFAPYW